MNLHLDLFEDKIELFEADRIELLEQKINEKIEHNKAILLSVHSVNHQVVMTPEGRPLYSAVVHFKRK
ncbi:DUF2536 family protein [Bacillus spongiae]|uniref:DUF2536 family protein n=1 Tax=Bacillus spongiae TaxID=2683610 RepID=A0ABU8H8Y1_9BACI